MYTKTHSLMCKINVPRKSASMHGFFIFASSISVIFVVLLENDHFKLSIYLQSCAKNMGKIAQVKGKL